MKLSALTPDSRNANKGTTRGRKLVRESLKRYGAGRSILLDKNGAIIAGNKTAEAAGAVGMEDVQIVKSDGSRLVAVQRTDLDINDKAARELAIADNRASEIGLEWDVDILKQFEHEEVDLSPFWDERELVSFFARPGGEAPEPKLDQAEALRQKWETKRGQIWEIGKHRLMCGDSTEVADLDRLMQGTKAEMLFTDPPYGVDYVGGHFHSGNVNIKRERERLAGDAQPQLYSAFIPQLPRLIDGPCYIWFAGREGLAIFAALEAAQLECHALIVWNKTNATYAAMNAQYKQRHEPCLYCKPKGSTLRWVGPTDECTVWDIPRDGRNDLHPTQKPVELAHRAINNHDAKTVADFFLGGAATMVAAEQLKRRCYALEIEPKYVAVALERLSDMGLKPVLAHA